MRVDSIIMRVAVRVANRKPPLPKAPAHHCLVHKKLPAAKLLPQLKLPLGFRESGKENLQIIVQYGHRNNESNTHLCSFAIVATAIAEMNDQQYSGNGSHPGLFLAFRIRRIQVTFGTCEVDSSRHVLERSRQHLCLAGSGTRHIFIWPR